MIKIQINLYEHREIDKVIIDNLMLKSSANSNSLVKDLLYKLALNINKTEPSKIEPSNIHQKEKTEQIPIEQKPVEKHEENIEKNDDSKSKLINSAKSLNIF